MTRGAWILLGAAALALGCADDDFEKRSELFRYRVIGIQADRPDPAPEDTVRIEALEYVPEGSAPVSRRWTVCLLSAGVVTQYECADERLEFPFYTPTPTLTLDLGPGGFLGPLGFRGVYAGAQAELARLREADPDARLPTLPDLRDGVPIYVKTRFAPIDAEAPELAVKTLIVRDGGARNHNPQPAEIVVPAEIFVGQKVRVRVKIAEGSIETYETDLREDDDRCEAIADDRYRCTEELTYAWYADGGEVEDPVGYAEFDDTQVTVPDEPGPFTLIVTVRDGRGGIGWLRRAVDVLPRE